MARRDPKGRMKHCADCPRHVKSKSTRCARCSQKHMAATRTKIRTCRRCSEPVTRFSKTGLCRRHAYDEDAIAKRRGADRYTSGKETAEDVLRRENSALRAELGKSRDTLGRLSGRATIEDRIARDVLEFL